MDRQEVTWYDEAHRQGPSVTTAPKNYSNAVPADDDDNGDIDKNDYANYAETHWWY